MKIKELKNIIKEQIDLSKKKILLQEVIKISLGKEVEERDEVRRELKDAVQDWSYMGNEILNGKIIMAGENAHQCLITIEFTNGDRLYYNVDYRKKDFDFSINGKQIKINKDHLKGYGQPATFVMNTYWKYLYNEKKKERKEYIKRNGLK